MPKLNPGGNVHGDNDTETARAGGMQDVSIPEPKTTEKGKFQCTVCNAVFNSRQDYVSHALAKHQPVTEETQQGARW